MTGPNKFKLFLSKLGPGFITGASDDDPSGIATYSQTGALFGYSQLWTAIFTFPFMTVIQEMCGRIGIVTGKGLAGVIRKHYSKKVLYFAVIILFIANTINIGADLGAMAASAQLIFGLPFYLWLILITLLCLSLQILIPYKLYSKFLKYLSFSLFAYIVCAFLVNQDWGRVLQSTIFPEVKLSREYLLNIIAILGTTISPYLFFWQTGEEVEEEVANHKLRSMGHGTPKISYNDIRDMRFDTVIGMFFSNLVMFFIILTSASTLGASGISSIETASDAALALKPIAGDLSYILFALGIIGTGLLAIPVLAGSSSYAIAETFQWEEGLYRRFQKASGFYLVIAIATLFGLFINLTPIPPFKLLYYTAILNGVCAPPLMILIMRISGNKKIMGEYTNGRFSTILGWILTLIMTGASIALLASFFF